MKKITILFRILLSCSDGHHLDQASTPAECLGNYLLMSKIELVDYDSTIGSISFKDISSTVSSIPITKRKWTLHDIREFFPNSAPCGPAPDDCSYRGFSPRTQNTEIGLWEGLVTLDDIRVDLEVTDICGNSSISTAVLGTGTPGDYLVGISQVDVSLSANQVTLTENFYADNFLPFLTINSDNFGIDWNNDSVVETVNSTTKIENHTYAAHGTYKIKTYSEDNDLTAAFSSAPDVLFTEIIVNFK